MAVKPDMNKDYTAAIQDAVSKGNYQEAAQLEQQLNAKIDILNDTGTNKWNAQKQSNYSQYLNTGNSTPSQDIKPTGGQYVAIDPTGVDNYHAKNTANNGMGMSASDLALLESYGQAYNNATTDAERQAAHAAAEALRAQYGYKGGEDGSQYIPTQQPVVTMPTFGDFSYSDAPTYNDQYSSRIDAMLNEILNRDKFSYNAMEDDLFLQYKDQYTREGERAMKDTLGQVAARTGGLASSYAVSAAQQQNNYYMQQLSDKIPELYQLAYQMYLDDIDLQVQDLGLLQGASDTAYNRYRDTMSDWRDDRDFAYGMYRDDIGDQKWMTEFNYGVGRDDIDDTWREKEWDYNTNKYASETAYDRAMDMLSAGVMPDSSMLSAAGLTTSQANTLLAAAKAKGSSGGGSGGGGGYKPKLSASAVLDALENGIVNDETLQAYKYYYGQDYDSKTKDPEELEESRLYESMNNLGVGPVTANFVLELKQYGGVVENKDGTVAWADGWDATNYKEKLEAAKRREELLNGDTLPYPTDLTNVFDRFKN